MFVFCRCRRTENSNTCSRRRFERVDSFQSSSEPEVWARCGNQIDREDHFEVVGAGAVKLCRVEHIVAWLLRGARWADGSSAGEDQSLMLVRRRSGAEMTESFDSPQALRVWASAGGHWAKSSDS